MKKVLNYLTAEDVPMNLSSSQVCIVSFKSLNVSPSVCLYVNLLQLYMDYINYMDSINYINYIDYMDYINCMDYINYINYINYLH